MRTMRPKRFWIFALITLVAGLALASSGYADWDPLFRTSQYYSEGMNAADYRFGAPFGLAVADFDGNGKPDVVTGNTLGGYDVLLHTTDPRNHQMFPPALRYSAGPGIPVLDVATADFNFDNRADLVLLRAADFVHTTVSVHRSPGFTPSQAYFVTGARKVVTGDVNYDGRPDVIMGGWVGPVDEIGVTVMLGMPGDTLSPPVAYVGPSSTDWTTDPHDMALADATGDGVLDVILTITTAALQPSFFIMKGTVTGTFSAAIGPIATASTPHGVAVGNFNGDTFPDVVVACPNSSQVQVFFGTGGGAFQAPVNHFLPIVASAVCLGDVDADGRLDIVVVTKEPALTVGSVGVIRNTGLGTFAAPVTYSGLPGVGEAALADMDADGRLDIVAAMYGGDGNARTHAVGLLRNDGNGGFRGGISGVEVNAPTGEAVGDFNRDGIPDLAIATASGVSLALGLGNGTFGSPTAFTGPANAVQLFPVDLDRNGTLDLILNLGGGSSYCSNNGSGTLAFGGMPGVTGGGAVAVFDMNRDGLLDILTYSGTNFTACINTSVVIGGNILLNFVARPSFSAGGDVNGLVVGDWNRDGIPDFATAGPVMQTFQGVGNGDFQLPTWFQAGRLYNAICAADFNRDGILDIAARETTQNVSSSEFSTRGIDVFEGAANGTFTRVRSLGTLEQRGWLLSAWDANRDGLPDLLSSSVSEAINGAYPQASVEVLLNANANDFGQRVGYALGAFPPVNSLNPAPNRRIATGDVNRDGVPDILPAVLGGSSRVIHTVLATPPPRGTGLMDPLLFSTLDFPICLAAGDLNRDGKPDVVTATNSAGPAVAVMLGSGNGALGSSTTLPQSYASQCVALADLNRDGILDIATSIANQTPRISTMLGAGDGTFGARNDYFMFAGLDFEIGDMNRDGIPDVVTSVQNSGQDSVLVLLGNGSGGFTASTKVAVGTTIYELDLADLNRDGYTDVVLAASSIKVVYGGPGNALSAPVTLAAPLTTCQVLCVADFNRDGLLDIAAGNSNTYYIVWGNAATPFATWASTVLPLIAYDMKAGEAAADGVPYLYVTTILDQIKVVSVSPAGALAEVASAAAGPTPNRLALADFNRDGALDAATTGSASALVSVNLHGIQLVTGVDASARAPEVAPAHLRQNYPNPFNPRTTIRYSLPRAERVALRVFDVRGRLVATLRDGVEPAGESVIEWDGRDRQGRGIPSGVYLYRLTTGSGETVSRRMVVVK